jgi:hypothetical protein
MEEDDVSTADLLAAWRDATRAAEVAERLAHMASEAADIADRSSLASEEIAKMAERAARAADRAATSAREAARRAAALARESRERKLVDADSLVATARAEEDRARDAYHRREQDARSR